MKGRGSLKKRRRRGGGKAGAFIVLKPGKEAVGFLTLTN